MSYQDVDWGYTNDAPPSDDPVKLSEVDAYFGKLGYKMVPREAIWYPIQWVSEKGSDPIILPPPHYRAEGVIGELVYHRPVIEDLLSRLGGGGNDDDSHKVKARKK